MVMARSIDPFEHLQRVWRHTTSPIDIFMQVMEVQLQEGTLGMASAQPSDATRDEFLSCQAYSVRTSHGSEWENHLEEDVVVATSDEAIAVAGKAAALGLIQGLCHATRIIQQRPPVHHYLQLPALHGCAALRPVYHHRHLPLAPLLCIILLSTHLLALRPTMPGLLFR